MGDISEEPWDACVAMWGEQGGETGRETREEPGPDSGRTIRPFTFIVALCGMGACKALSKGVNGLVCFNRIILPPELRVA